MLFGHPINMTTGRYSETDDSLSWLPCVRYDLLIPGLDSEEYKTQMKEVQYLANFISEWFIPAEMVCQVNIKEYGQEQLTDTRLTLNYNTHLWI